jgi:cytochrome b pre-mRNA-processing protein 3
MSVFSKLKDMFKSPYDNTTATALYVAIVQQARQLKFYQDYQVADTLDGRFDMVALHTCLVLRRLRNEHEQTKDLSQAVFDLMFADMDQNLRELSIGDTGVAKRIKKMASGFYGRLAAYDLSLNMKPETASVEELKKVIVRNIYRNTVMSEDSVDAMAHYIIRQATALEQQQLGMLMDGNIEFIMPNFENRDQS